MRKEEHGKRKVALGLVLAALTAMTCYLGLSLSAPAGASAASANFYSSSASSATIDEHFEQAFAANSDKVRGALLSASEQSASTLSEPELSGNPESVQLDENGATQKFGWVQIHLVSDNSNLTNNSDYYNFSGIELLSDRGSTTPFISNSAGDTNKVALPIDTNDGVEVPANYTIKVSKYGGGNDWFEDESASYSVSTVKDGKLLTSAYTEESPMILEYKVKPLLGNLTIRYYSNVYGLVSSTARLNSYNTGDKSLVDYLRETSTNDIYPYDSYRFNYELVNRNGQVLYSASGGSDVLDAPGEKVIKNIPFGSYRVTAISENVWHKTTANGTGPLVQDQFLVLPSEPSATTGRRLVVDPQVGTLYIKAASTNWQILNTSVQKNPDATSNSGAKSKYTYDGIKFLVREDAFLDTPLEGPAKGVITLANDGTGSLTGLLLTDKYTIVQTTEGTWFKNASWGHEQDTWSSVTTSPLVKDNDNGLYRSATIKPQIDPKLGTINIQAHDVHQDSAGADGLNDTYANPAYNFKDIQYAVYNDRMSPYNGGTGTPVTTITLNEAGFGTAYGFLLGDTYTLVETKTNEYYVLDSTPITVTAPGGASSIYPTPNVPGQDVTLTLSPKLTYIDIVKGTDDWGVTNPAVQGSTADNSYYNYADIMFQIKNQRTGAVVVDNIALDRSGHARTSANLMFDRYELTEVQKNDFYRFGPHGNGLVIKDVEPKAGQHESNKAAGSDPVPYFVTKDQDGCVDSPELGRIELTKTSTDPGSLNPTNPYYNFAGIQYEVYNQRAVDAGRTAPVGTITLDASGYGSIDGLHLGDKYFLKEKSTNRWYVLNSSKEWRTLTPSTGTEIRPLYTSPYESPNSYHKVEVTVQDDPVYIYFDLNKKSADPSITNPNGVANSMYSLSGAEYTITNTRTGAVVPTKMRTNANGKATSVKLLVDDYSVKETLASTGYALDTTEYATGYDKFSLERDSDHTYGHYSASTNTMTLKRAGADITEPAQADVSFGIDKYNAEAVYVPESHELDDYNSGAPFSHTSKDVSPTCATLEDGIFKVDYYSSTSASSSATVHNTWYVGTDRYGDADMTKVLPSATVNGSTVISDPVYTKEGKVVIPIGTVTYQEVKAPTGWMLDNGRRTGAGSIHTVRATNDVTTSEWRRADYKINAVPEHPIRDGYTFTKTDATAGSRMPGIPFVIESKTTGEQHIVVTNANGTFSSESNRHSSNTNAFDAAAVKDASGKVIGVNEDQLVAIYNDTSGAVGTWFFGFGPKNDPDGAQAAAVRVDDSVMAFPYDPKEGYADDEEQLHGYNVRELAVSANEFKDTLEERYFYVSLDGVNEGGVTNGGNINNYTVDIDTVAIDGSGTLTHEGIAADTVVIDDEVTYRHLIAGHSYYIEGRLMNYVTGTPLLDESGREITSRVDFTAESDHSTQHVKFEMPHDIADAQSIVVYERLYRDNGRLLAIHDDRYDADQRVCYPHVDSELTDFNTQQHYGSLQPTTTLTDKLYFWALEAGADYKFTLSLVEKGTGASVNGADGKPVVKEVEFTPEYPNSYFPVSIEVPEASISGKTVVALVTLTRGDNIVTTASSINDPDQFVVYPNASFVTLDNVLKRHEGNANDSTVIIDTIAYRNLVAGKTYKAVSQLYDVATGLPAMNGTKELVTEKTFTASGTASPYYDGFCSGSVQVPFYMSKSMAEGKTFAATTVVYCDDAVPVLISNDIGNAAKQVAYPKLRTYSLATEEDYSGGNGTKWVKLVTGELVKGTKTPSTSTETVVVDTVTYSNLKERNGYMLVGSLFDKSSGNALRDSNGNQITSVVTFTPMASSGEIDVTFTFDSSALYRKSIVVYETLYHTPTLQASIGIDPPSNVLVGSHQDLTSSDQTLTFSYNGTSSGGASSGTSATHQSATSQIGATTGSSTSTGGSSNSIGASTGASSSSSTARGSVGATTSSSSSTASTSQSTGRGSVLTTPTTSGSTSGFTGLGASSSTTTARGSSTTTVTRSTSSSSSSSTARSSSTSYSNAIGASGSATTARGSVASTARSNSAFTSGSSGIGASSSSSTAKGSTFTSYTSNRYVSPGTSYSSSTRSTSTSSGSGIGASSSSATSKGSSSTASRATSSSTSSSSGGYISAGGSSATARKYGASFSVDAVASSVRSLAAYYAGE